MLARKNRGFTLVEILIVVIILGILAAIVIPQFTSASQDARRSSMASTVQSLRSQIELYKLQHTDTVPDLTAGWTPLTTVTLADGTASTIGTVGAVGPYMQATPTNPFIAGAASSTVTSCTGVPAPDGTSGFYQDLSTGKIWGVAPDPADNTKWVAVGD